MLINKKKRIYPVDFDVPVDQRLKTKKVKDGQILGSCQRAEKAVEHGGDGDINNSWHTRNSPQGLGKKMAELKIRGRIKAIQRKVLLRLARILSKSPEIFSITQIPVKGYQQTLL